MKLRRYIIALIIFSCAVGGYFLGAGIARETMGDDDGYLQSPKDSKAQSLGITVQSEKTTEKQGEEAAVEITASSTDSIKSTGLEFDHDDSSNISDDDLESI